MQKFIADGCREALLEEKRRFCFLADKHCVFSYQIGNFHDKVSRGQASDRATAHLMHGLQPFFWFTGQGGSIRKHSEVAGEMHRHQQSTRRSGNNDKRAFCYSGANTQGWTPHKGEFLSLYCTFGKYTFLLFFQTVIFLYIEGVFMTVKHAKMLLLLFVEAVYFSCITIWLYAKINPVWDVLC